MLAPDMARSSRDASLAFGPLSASVVVAAAIPAPTPTPASVGPALLDARDGWRCCAAVPIAGSALGAPT